MTMLLIVGLLLTGTSAAMVLRAATLSRVRLAQHLRSVDAYGFAAADVPEPADDSPAVGRLAARIGGLVAAGDRVDVAATRRMLLAAGAYRITAEEFLGYRVLAALGLPALLAWVAAGMGPALAGAGIVIGGLLGWRMPWVVLERRGKDRAAKIDREMPELIDLLVVTVEAGLTLSASLQMAATRLRDPLGGELRLTLQEQSMGLSVEDSLNNLVERCDTPAVRGFVRSIVRGESLGVSIGAMLRNLAIDMRRQRRAAAEERIQKAPVKMLFPLVFLIFPCVLLVLLGPAAFMIKDAF